MYMLRFLLTRYALPFYMALAAAVVVGMMIVASAWFTAWFEPVAVVFGILFGALAAGAATFAITVLNAVLAAGLGRRFEHFVAAYDAWRRANGIVDPFYAEMDLAEEAEREAARGAT